jgi:hypothetical protein
MHVAAADTTCGHTYQQLARTRRGHRNIHDLQVLVLVQKQGLHRSHAVTSMLKNIYGNRITL